MNKIITIFLAIIGGVDVVMTIVTPAILILLWIKIFGITDTKSVILLIITLVSTLFRAIKIGYLKN
jgi:hypothetical protein